ncbi:hypothetical protein JOC86_000846 [Bacillus pakistanensis]|uniref:DUF2515 domain-containing protein n=1 Tax=Rossellomorea pakistanensis TaxID=992288 RepID=A0ABS2N8X2_9BACI|nr:DUF2515 family protein [Bacillus pakistanensis]MBM7584309.1 hypothetical protein [Bacillus pakistanensis]
MNKKGIFQRFLPDFSHIKTISELIDKIHTITFEKNLDNISRTIAYQKYFLLHPEIKWSFLASMVSRNAGWNMCDLKGNWLNKILDEKMTKQLFLTYERANWLIFQDVFPQLLIYHYSTYRKKEMFHLLSEFFVSKFMRIEWEKFWRDRNEKRLVYSLIINEQNVIQKPVIEHPIYKRRVFSSKFFIFQDLFHFSSCIFPTVNGNLYGASVHNFRKLDQRINLGKSLYQILFQKELFPYFLQFSLETEPTGSRKDYERYMINSPGSRTPILRAVFPVVEHHRHLDDNWTGKIKPSWEQDPPQLKKIELTDWYVHKQYQLHSLICLNELLFNR